MNPFFTTEDAKQLVKKAVTEKRIRKAVIADEFRGKASKNAGQEYGNTGRMLTSVILGGKKFNVTLQITAYEHNATAPAASDEAWGSLEEVESLLE